MEFEADIIKFLQANAGNGWITVFQIITMFGSYLGFLIAFVVIFVKNRNLSYVFAITFALASLINAGLKLIIARPRPFEAYSFISNLDGADGFSMPSGHSLCAGLFASFLTYHLWTQRKDKLTRTLGTICLSLFPVVIGFSRMILGVHYLTDVIVGIILGIMFAIVSIWVYNMVVKSKTKGKENDTTIQR